MERPFDVIPGVLSVLSGYTGGDVPAPSYADDRPPRRRDARLREIWGQLAGDGPGR